MSLIGRLIPSVLNRIPSITSITNTIGLQPGGLFGMPVRTVIRCNFPRPSERRRVKRHGWKTRLSSEEGKRTLMRRILKGRHVYSH